MPRHNHHKPRKTVAQRKAEAEAASHVATNQFDNNDPGADDGAVYEVTIKFNRHLASHGDDDAFKKSIASLIEKEFPNSYMECTVTVKWPDEPPIVVDQMEFSQEEAIRLLHSIGFSSSWADQMKADGKMVYAVKEVRGRLNLGLKQTINLLSAAVGYNYTRQT